MGDEIWINPVAVTAVRTSVERVVMTKGRGLTTTPFRAASEFPAFWQDACARWGDDDLTLAIAEELPVGSFGRTSYAIVSAPTVAAAFEVFCFDAQRSVTGLTAHVDRIGRKAILAIDGVPELAPLYEIMLGILALRGRQLANPPVVPERVELTRRPPAIPSRWQRVFGAIPTFAAATSALVFPEKLLNQPLRTAEPSIHSGLGATITLAELVRAHVEARLCEVPQASAVARALGLSTRTLQRRLGEEKLTFRRLVLETKLAAARRLLDRHELSIGEIAAAVGFGGVAAFSAAFSQETGLSPSQFRKR